MPEASKPSAWRVATSFVRMGRPLFLVGGALLYGLGVVLALLHGGILDLERLLAGQAVVTAGQLLTHYSNEFFDLPSDRLHDDRPRWSGGSGVLPSGILRPRTALAAAIGSGLIALAFVAWLATSGQAPPLALAVLLLSLALAWSYSAPPLRLHGTGSGEPIAATLLAILTPLAGYTLQLGPRPMDAVLALLPLWLLQLAMLITVSLPDVAADRAAGKRTLAVRIRPVRAERVAATAVDGAFLVVVFVWALGAGLAVLAVLPWLPLGAWHARELVRGRARATRTRDRTAFWAIGLVVGPTGCMLLLTLWLAQPLG